jgi:hypothetical protein
MFNIFEAGKFLKDILSWKVRTNEKPIALII